MLGEDIERDSWIFALAAHTYYHGEGDEQSPLSDSEYDQLKTVIQINWHEVPSELQKIMESPTAISCTGMHIHLLPHEKAYAQSFLK